MIIEETIFDKELVVSEEDWQRLRDHITGWSRLHKYLKSGECNVEDMQKLFLMEKKTQNRLHLLRRLHSRINSMERYEQMKQLGIDE